MTNTDNPIEAVRARLDGGRKWHKGDWDDGSGKVCILGALAELHDSYEFDEEIAIREVIEEQFPDRAAPTGTKTRVVPLFNDHPATTFADVDLVLDKAARAWDERA